MNETTDQIINRLKTDFNRKYQLRCKRSKYNIALLDRRAGDISIDNDFDYLPNIGECIRQNQLDDYEVIDSSAGYVPYRNQIETLARNGLFDIDEYWNRTYRDFYRGSDRVYNYDKTEQYHQPPDASVMVHTRESFCNKIRDDVEKLFYPDEMCCQPFWEHYCLWGLSPTYTKSFDHFIRQYCQRFVLRFVYNVNYTWKSKYVDARTMDIWIMPNVNHNLLGIPSYSFEWDYQINS